jgi:hypothetical protein
LISSQTEPLHGRDEPIYWPFADESIGLGTAYSWRPNSEFSDMNSDFSGADQRQKFARPRRPSSSRYRQM